MPRGCIMRAPCIRHRINHLRSSSSSFFPHGRLLPPPPPPWLSANCVAWSTRPTDSRMAHRTISLKRKANSLARVLSSAVLTSGLSVSVSISCTVLTISSIATDFRRSSTCCEYSPVNRPTCESISLNCA